MTTSILPAAAFSAIVFMVASFSSSCCVRRTQRQTHDRTFSDGTRNQEFDIHSYSIKLNLSHKMPSARDWSICFEWGFCVSFEVG